MDNKPTPSSNAFGNRLAMFQKAPQKEEKKTPATMIDPSTGEIIPIGKPKSKSIYIPSNKIEQSPEKKQSKEEPLIQSQNVKDRLALLNLKAMPNLGGKPSNYEPKKLNLESGNMDNMKSILEKKQAGSSSIKEENTISNEIIMSQEEIILGKPVQQKRKKKMNVTFKFD